jgi:hypothetical protein
VLIWFENYFAISYNTIYLSKLIIGEISFHLKKKFDRTDKLRERLIKVNSMALNEIINSRKIIEAERS